MITVRLLEKMGVKTLAVALCMQFFLSACGGKKHVTYISLEDRNSDAYSRVDNRTEAISRRLEDHYGVWKGTRYQMGGQSPDGVDCSGFVQLTFLELFDKKLPRTVQEQIRQGKEIGQRRIKPGDLLFFKTGLWQRHVGIYLGDDIFIHASKSKGVTKSTLSDNYWQKHYWKAQRL